MRVMIAFLLLAFLGLSPPDVKAEFHPDVGVSQTLDISNILNLPDQAELVPEVLAVDVSYTAILSADLSLNMKSDLELASIPGEVYTNKSIVIEGLLYSIKYPLIIDFNYNISSNTANSLFCHRLLLYPIKGPIQFIESSYNSNSTSRT